MIVGYCVGEISLSELTFISDKMPQVGEYVTVEYDERKVLGMVESLVRGNDALNLDLHDVDAIQTISRIGGDEYYVKGKVKLLGDVDDNLRLPRTPAIPGTPIRLADEKILADVFRVDNPLNIGTLVNQSNIDVNVEANPILNRHLAILAMTGAGKSNTVAVLIDQLLKYNVPVFVFDMHGEYIDAEFPNGNVNIIHPKINPLYMSFHEIKKLVNIPNNAFIQERHFRSAFKETKDNIAKGKVSRHKFLESIQSILYSRSLEEGSDKQIVDVINKIEDAIDKYSNLFDNNKSNIISSIKVGYVNVLDLSQSDEAVSEVLVSHIMRNSLRMRKNAVHGNDSKNILDHPVFYIIEEAHILAPNKRDSSSKFWIQRVAREGRKFGLGLCLVSQSPKTVDHDALSQMNNMIILRLVEPDDQRHVQSASESLSKDLIDQLPSLNVGEAIVLGLMTRIPTLVKINEFKGRRTGGDLDIIGDLADYNRNDEEEIKRQEDESLNLGYDY